MGDPVARVIAILVLLECLHVLKFRELVEHLHGNGRGAGDGVCLLDLDGQLQDSHVSLRFHNLSGYCRPLRVIETI